MGRNISITTIAILFSVTAFAQKDFARKVVDTLASPYMGGRGYVDDGNQRAATYLNNEFKSLGLTPFGKSYLQKFEYPVNTYPTPYIISINGKLTTPGADYIVIPSTTTIKGAFPVVRFDRTILNDSIKLQKFLTHDYSNTFILIDDSGANPHPQKGSPDEREKQFWESLKNTPDEGGSNPFKAKGMIILCDKLTEETSESVADYALIHALRNTSFRYATSISVDIKNKFIKSFPTQNLIGYIKGNVRPDSFIVFTAHYDHLGKMGSIYFPGANDNASGIAMLLSLAKYYSMHKDSLRYSIAFMAFSGEEIAMLGSKYYTEHPLFPLTDIRFLINMDIMGTGDEGITVVNGTIFKSAYNDLVKINDEYHLLKLVKLRGETANSDHYYFYKNHVPAIFIYTMGGIKAYHDIYDRRETLPLTNFNEVFKLLIEFTADINQRKF
ncbi:MAG TPA: M28 family peptidase [Bacteroidia bacterium]|jgi:aminopeptidase YwaD|nr:M28 family peptidase [Bacteroidia bacterium]